MDDEDLSVELRSAQGERTLRMGSPLHPWDDDFVDVIVQLDGQGLHAETSMRTIGGDGLVTFLEQLASDYRGWDGSREWRSLDDQLHISATWRSRGRVALHFTLRPTVYEFGWEAGATFEVEAGAELELLATNVSRLLTTIA